MTLIYWARTIPVRWYKMSALAACALALAAAPPKRPVRRAPVPAASKASNTELAALVRAYRAAPSSPGLAALAAYTRLHETDASGALAHLALGVAAYEQKDFDNAVSHLRGLGARLPKLADYIAYYSGAAHVELNDGTNLAQELAPAHRESPVSPLGARAWLLEGRGLQPTNPAAAARLLAQHYMELPQPEGDLMLADSYQAAQDFPQAARLYQRIYYQRLSGFSAAKSTAALVALKDSMGASYPQPVPRQMLQHASLLLDARQYRDAREEYNSLVQNLTGTEQAEARVGFGAASLMEGSVASACAYLRGLELPESDAEAQQLFYVEECARRQNADDGIQAALGKLAQKYPRSPWRLQALLSAANRYLVTNRPDAYLPLYRAIYENFPDDPSAPHSHWKIAIRAYLDDQQNAMDLLREHLERYPQHATAPAALYFLGRHAEREGDFPSAAGFYTQLTGHFPNTYYGMLGRQRLTAGTAKIAPAPAQTASFLSTLTLPDPKPVPAPATSATRVRMERAKLLRTAGLNDLADLEARFGARTDGQATLLAMDMAQSAEAPYLGLRIMKSLTSDYLNLPVPTAPRKYWELLFPLPYREALFAGARTQDLDPYLVAGLIRQESEFNPEALSRANAYGLTQVRPATGREFARRAGVTAFTTRALYEPVVNLKIGTAIFRSMLDRNGGKLEQTLAAYNAGPARVTEWLTWREYREPAEFVESIPFTETRDYVQAVLRNADMYRRLYQQN